MLYAKQVTMFKGWNEISKSAAASLGCWLLILTVHIAVVSVKRDSSFSVDAKVYYMAAATLASEGNPYSSQEMTRTCLRLDPKGLPVGSGGEAVSNLPATFLPVFPLLALKWDMFEWMQLAGSTLCIPLSALLTIQVFGWKQSWHRICLYSFLAAIFPPVWRTCFVGQNTLFVLVIQLAAVLAVDAGSFLSASTFVLLSYVKLTCSFATSAFMFFRDFKRSRLSVLISIAVFLLLNLLLFMHIGLRTSIAAYSRNAQIQFNANGVNDAYTTARNVRIDIEPLLAEFTGRHEVSVVKTGVLAAALVPLLVLARIRRNDRGVIIAGVLLFSLLACYHRPYDAVLALPLLFLAVDDLYKRNIGTGLLRLSPLIAAAVLLGDHNIFSTFGRFSAMSQAPWLRPTIILAMYFSAVVPPLISERRQSHVLAMERPIAE